MYANFVHADSDMTNLSLLVSAVLQNTTRRFNPGKQSKLATLCGSMLSLTSVDSHNRRS
jgi:hypothetical protein